MLDLDLTRLWAEPAAGLAHALRGMGAIACWRLTETGNPTAEAMSVGAASVHSEARATRLPAGAVPCYDTNHRRNAMVRCKFVLNTVTRKMGYVGTKPAEVYDAEFSAVYSTDPTSENKRFWDATPGGTFRVTTIKEMPWELGKEYYFDITPA